VISAGFSIGVVASQAEAGLELRRFGSVGIIDWFAPGRLSGAKGSVCLASETTDNARNGMAHLLLSRRGVV
jgi:hypothetical protein